MNIIHLICTEARNSYSSSEQRERHISNWTFVHSFVYIQLHSIRRRGMEEVDEKIVIRTKKQNPWECIESLKWIWTGVHCTLCSYIVAHTCDIPFLRNANREYSQITHRESPVWLSFDVIFSRVLSLLCNLQTYILGSRAIQLNNGWKLSPYAGPWLTVE